MLCDIIHGMDKFLLLFSAIALICMLAMMFFVSPSEIGPLGILTFFAMLYFVFVGLAVFGCRLFFALRAKLDKTKKGKDAHNLQMSRMSYLLAWTHRSKSLLIAINGAALAALKQRSKQNKALIIAIANYKYEPK